MSDFIAQGQPFETPVGAAMDEYAKTPPSFSKAAGAFFGESSTLAETGRGIERSQYTSMTDRQEAEAQGRMAAADPNLMPGQPPQDDYFDGLKSGPAIPTPTLSAEDANKKYAPIGPDGKQTKITDQPIPEGVAQLVGKAKSDEIEREGIISRYSDAHSLPVTFGTGLVGFMMDPLNTASLFLPGLGEETVLNGLGRVGMATSSIAAKTVSRATAGAVTGGISQAPLSLARWGMGTEEASDYSLRDAFKDMAFASAGGAILHAGFGAVGDALRARRVMPADIAAEAATAPPNAMAGDAASILHADAPTKMDAMRSAVAQVAEGREVDVLPVFDVNAMRLVSEAAQLRARHGELTEFLGGLDNSPEGPAAAERLARVGEVERQMNVEGIEADQRRTLSNRRDELLANTTPETLREQAAPVELRRQAEAQQTNIEARLQEITAAQTQARAQTTLSPFAQIAEKQRDIYREGFTPGVPAAEARATQAAMYGPKEPAATPKPEPVASAKPSAAAEAKPVTPLDHDLATAEARLSAAQKEGVAIHPDDQAEIERTAKGMEQADSKSQALQQAAQCLAMAAE